MAHTCPGNTPDTLQREPRKSPGPGSPLGAPSTHFLSGRPFPFGRPGACRFPSDLPGTPSLGGLAVALISPWGHHLPVSPARV